MNFNQRLKDLEASHEGLIDRKNAPVLPDNGIVTRYKYPVLTAAHIPLNWRYDLSQKRNPYLQERIGVNAVFNAGAIYFNDKYVLATRVEGADRKSFFAVAESSNGIDHFTFRQRPITMETTLPLASTTLSHQDKNRTYDDFSLSLQPIQAL